MLGKLYEIFKNILIISGKKFGPFSCDICGFGKFFWAWHSVFDTGVVKISFPTLGQGTFSPTLDLIKVNFPSLARQGRIQDFF